VGGRLHYCCSVRLNDIQAFVAWYSDEPDGFVRDLAGRLVTATTPEALTSVGRLLGIALVDQEPADYDFDRIGAWCADPEEAGLDCPEFLNAWNFFDDLAGLHGGADSPFIRLSRGASDCYDKLFWGCNLPAVTPPGRHFEPAWSVEEVAQIQRVMQAGLRLLEAELGTVSG
jgi:hypothetical protein